MNPVVSVVIPAYNRLDYIDQTVQSVLNQSYPRVELIIVDDGSTDGTFEKLQSYGNAFLLLTHDGRENRGQSASINLGIKSASGDFLAILDSDDYWSLDKLDKQVSFLEDHPDIGLVYSNGHGVTSTGEIFYEIYSRDHFEPNDPDKVLLDCYILLPQNSLVRKSLYDEAGVFDESLRAAQDHDMLIRLSEVTRFAYIPDFLFFYRRHEGSISTRNQELRWLNGFKILEKARKRFPYKSSTIRKRRAVICYRLGMCYQSEKRFLKAAWFFCSALALDPLRAVMVVLKLETAR